MQLFDINYNVDKQSDLITRTQHISDDFLAECNDNRIASTSGKMGDWHQVASIPVVIVEKWLREGFDIYQEPLKAIVRKLHTEDLSAFLTTAKHI